MSPSAFCMAGRVQSGAGIGGVTTTLRPLLSAEVLGDKVDINTDSRKGTRSFLSFRIGKFPRTHNICDFTHILDDRLGCLRLIRQRNGAYSTLREALVESIGVTEKKTSWTYFARINGNDSDYYHACVAGRAVFYESYRQV